MIDDRKQGGRHSTNKKGLRGGGKEEGREWG